MKPGDAARILAMAKAFDSPAGWILFHAALPNILTDGAWGYASALPTIDNQAGTHDVTFSVSGGILYATWAASNKPCYYLVSEYINPTTPSASTGDIYRIITSSLPALPVLSGSGSANEPFSHMFMYSGFGPGSSTCTTLIYVPASSAFTTPVAWNANCTAGASRSVHYVDYYVGAFRFAPLG